MSKSLGEGSYGIVTERGGLAVKEFSNVIYLLQEYSSLRLLSTCPHVVKAVSANLEQRSIAMELHVGNLSSWARRNRDADDYLPRLKNILSDIFMGIHEIHTIGLVHGDVKCGNILITKDEGAVIGDCGFTSIEGHAKVRYTAPGYREPNHESNKAHDLYSLGVMVTELLTGRHPTGDPKKRNNPKYFSHSTVREVAASIEDPLYRDIALGFLRENRDSRLTASKAYQCLTGGNYVFTSKRLFERRSKLQVKGLSKIEKVFIREDERIRVRRNGKCLSALVMFLSTHPNSDIEIYSKAALYIAASHYGYDGGSTPAPTNDVTDAALHLLEDDAFIYYLLHE